MRVVGYIRVSTDDQAQEGISLEAQQGKIEAYCRANDWQLLSKHEAALVSMQEHLDATTTACRLMMNFLACVREWEREVIGQRTKEAMSYLKEQQKVYSRPVYGYDCRGGRLFVNTKEQATIEQARELRALGYRYGSTAAGLNSKGVPTKRGEQWQAQTVRRILLKSSCVPGHGCYGSTSHNYFIK